MLFSRPAESFNEVHKEEGLTDAIDLGLRAVELRHIVGSVNRWQDFDSQFRMRNRSTRYRYEQIKKAVERGESIPAVELYKIKDKYYVVDGNHRVSAAKQVGQTYMDAHVIEYLPPADNKEHLLWRERSNFERRTNLAGIEFTELGSFRKLLLQVEEFRREESAVLREDLTLATAAQSWSLEIYEPVVAQIRQEKLLDDFPNRTEADLFLYATYHKMAKNRLGPKPISYREVLEEFRSQTFSRTLGQKIVDTVTSVFHLADHPAHCPHGLLLDEDGLVKIVRECRGCQRCAPPEPDTKTLIRDDDGY